MGDSECIGYEPCPDCGSRDNLARFSDGHGFCFTTDCGYKPPAGDGAQLLFGAPRTEELRQGWSAEGQVAALPARKLSLETCRKFGYAQGSGFQIAPFFDTKGRLVAQKLRYPDKRFEWRGDAKRATLFGSQLWRTGGRRVVVTEGEIDAMSVAQAFNLRWPAVSVRNGASSAARDIREHLEWLESYQEVVLCFDQDEPGRKAAAECADLLSPGKARIAQLPRKDANEMVVAGEEAQLVGCLWEAKEYRPDGVVAAIEKLEEALVPLEAGLSYPWPGLNVMLLGQRTDELVLWCGGTGAGKTYLARELAHNLHRQGEKVGIIALEESVRRTVLGQVALEMNIPLHLPHYREKAVIEDLRSAAVRALTLPDERGNAQPAVWCYAHFGSVDAKILLPRIRYMVKAFGVRWVVIDHVSIMVSGTATEGDERKRIDEIMTTLRTLASELNIGIHLVSHLRKADGTPHEEGGRIHLDDLRGSGGLKQLPDTVIGAERNQQADDLDERHTLKLRVLKNRFSGETGVAAHVRFVSETGRLVEVPPKTDEAGDF